MDRLQQMNPASLMRRQVPASSRFASGNPGRLTTIHSASSSSRFGLMPPRQVEKAIRSNQIEEPRIRQCLRAAQPASRPCSSARRHARGASRSETTKRASTLHASSTIAIRSAKGAGTPLSLQRLPPHRRKQNPYPDRRHLRQQSRSQYGRDAVDRSCRRRGLLA